MKTILFDIGNVLLFFDFNRTLEKLGIDTTTPPPELLEDFFALRDRVETGELPGDAFLEQISALTHFTGGIDAMRDAYCDIFTPNEKMWDTLRSISGSAQTVLFSNTSDVHMKFIRQRYPDFTLFDNAVLSYEAGASKPRSPMYQDAIDRVGVDPKQTFYIDDLLANINTGEDFEFTCHHYQSDRHDALVADLDAFLAR